MAMDFSGERYVPGQGWASIGYEHVSRYLFAQPLAAGKHVLDVGSGEGYGSRLLASYAASVVGVDVSPEAVQHATERYAAQSPNVRYVQGSATALPVESKSIDLVVAFEILEHIVEHDEMLAEVRRVLRPEGLFLVSTPNKFAYSDLPGVTNPFHLKELYFDEFRALVQSHFRAARYFAQKNLTGSVIAPLDETQATALHIRRIRRRDVSKEFEPTELEPADHMYFIAACSDSVEAVATLSGAVVADRDERLLREIAEGAERQLAQARRAQGANAHDRATVELAMRSAMHLAGTLTMQRQKMADEAGEAPPESHTYDLIIPVFNAPAILKACLDSLLANTDHKHLVHVIDDASTDPRVETMMRGYVARHAHVRYYRLPANLGFPGAVNAGFASTTHDVVLVNADTEFPPNWLARMDRCRRSNPAIHAISPLSNNATICSVPASNQKNALPPGLSVADMDRLVQQTTLRRYPRVPTVVGFCMLMTRRAIDDVGPFDMAFGRGYGEEVDWCQRAWARGYESAICDDVYVYHHGEVAFSQVPEKRSLQQASERRVTERWPRYTAAVRAYCALNPLRFQQHRLFETLRQKPPARTRVLHVIHRFDQPTGTEIFTRQLIDGMRDEALSTVLFPAALSPYQDGTVEEEGRGLVKGGLLKVRINSSLFATGHAVRGIAISLRSQQAERFFAETLAASGAQVVQFDHLANLGSLALPLIARALGAKVVLVLHDYFLLCPDWSLLHANGKACGESRAAFDNPRCIDCLGRRIQSRAGLPALDLGDVLAKRAALCRAILMQADVLVAPSAFVRDQFTRAWGRELGERIRIVPHGTMPHPYRADYEPRKQLRVAFLGNANQLKGVDTFAEAALRMQGTSVRFRILGGLSANSAIGARDNLALHGPYVQRELSQLLQDVDVVCIGSIANESYCFTVDESFRAGVPVIATAVGAIPERVTDGVTGILIPPRDAAALVSAIERLDGDRGLLATMRRNVAGLRLRSIAETVSEYVRIYAELAPDRATPDITRKAMIAIVPTSAELPITLGAFAAAKGLDLQLPLSPEGARPVAVAHRKTKARRTGPNHVTTSAPAGASEAIAPGSARVDPPQPTRDVVPERHGVATGPGRGILHIVHGHGGGTEQQVRALIDASPARYRHYIATAVGDAWRLEERLDGGATRKYALQRRWDEAWPDFVGGICSTFGIGLAHLHNVSGCRNGIIAALSALGLPYGYTVHDLDFACPTMSFLGADGNYCFEQTDPAVCGPCLAAQRAFAHIDIEEWRARHRLLLAGASFIVAPSRWAAAALGRYYPECTVAVIPHGVPAPEARQAGDHGTTAAASTPAPLGDAGFDAAGRHALQVPNDGVATVAVLGAIGPDKGARRLEKLVGLVRKTGARLRLVLIGYMDARREPWQSADAVLTVHGRYAPRDLPALLDHYRARLVAFPSAGPETFSFTLSEAWAAGRPVIVPPFGALGERVEGTEAGWLWTESEWRDEAKLLARLVELLAPSFAAELAAAARRASTLPLPTVSAMAERTLAHYDAVVADVVLASAPLDPARMCKTLDGAP